MRSTMHINTIDHRITRRHWLRMAASFAGVTLLSGTISACSKAGGKTGDNVTQLSLGCKGEELAFDHVTLTAPAGATVELIFHNRSNHLQHNWVLANGGDEVAMAIYEAAMAAGVKQRWLPPASAQIIAHTPLVNSGKRATITFQTPTQAGDYSYLCTFPGHFLAGMKGTLTLT